MSNAFWIVSPALAQAIAPASLAPGTYTNEEEVYFAREARQPAAPWISLTIDASGRQTFSDAFGRTTQAPAYRQIGPAIATDRLTLEFVDGRKTELRRARGFTCWGAVPKSAKNADGSENWFGARNLKLHDQGGRVAFGGGDSGAPETILKMRNVIWPSGPNRPSLVLYVHSSAEAERAVGYSWADKDAKTVGINLRWMQASCTIDPT